MNENQIQDQVMKSQGYAVSIETMLREIFGCDRYGFGGLVNSDAIRRHPFLSITQGLAYLYALYPEKRNAIENFNENFSFYENMRLDDLLSFDTNEKVIDRSTIQIEKENGLEQVEYMIEEFRKIVE